MIELQARVGDKDVGRKIKYFVRGDMQISYAQFSSLKTSGGLKVNGAVVHANYELCSGDLVSVSLPERPSVKNVTAENAPVSIVYEDDDVYIIDKIAPLACQCTPRQPSGTLENRLHARFSELDGFVFRPLNRLDKGTSGLMAAAKHAHAYQLMQKQLHTPDFVREYLAVAEGVLEGEGTIELPIAKEAAATVRRVIDYERGAHAVTHYRSVRSDGQRTLLQLRLETGRTHQIRVHLSAIGHPIAGDFLYGSELETLPNRFALHSARISFVHPISGERLRFSSPLPSEIKELMHE